MGIDKFQEDVDTDEESTRNDMQADFLSVLVMDESTGESRILQINRDTMTSVPILDIFGNSAGTMKEQIALAHTYGTGDTDSCRNTAKGNHSYIKIDIIDNIKQKFIRTNQF